MSPADVEHRAQELAEMYSDFEWLEFYKNVVERLPEGKIQYLIESSNKSRNPMRYFKAAAKKEMAKL